MTEHNQLKLSAIVAASAGALLLSGLMIKYHDRAIFDEHNQGTKAKKGYPLLGNITDILKEKDTIHEMHLKALNQEDTMTL